MSRYKQVYLLKKKSEAFPQFKEFVAEAEHKLGTQVKQLHYQYAIRKETLKPVRNGLCADGM